MSKSTIICKSCGTDNEPGSEFCIDCGVALDNTEVSTKPEPSEAELSEEEKRRRDYKNWKMSLPYLIAVCIFLILIDLMTGGGAFDWSFWAVVPILLFAVGAPYFSFKMGLDE